MRAMLLASLLLAGCSALSPVSRAEVPEVDDALQRRVRSELAVFTDWLAEHGVRGYVGEVGWPDDVDGEHDRWNAVAEAWVQDADDAELWTTYWATGE